MGGHKLIKQFFSSVILLSASAARSITHLMDIHMEIMNKHAGRNLSQRYVALIEGVSIAINRNY